MELRRAALVVDVVVPVILEGLRAELLSDEAIERGRQIVAYGPTAPYVAEGIRAIIEAALGFPDSEKAP
jgi:hypothetical protein